MQEKTSIIILSYNTLAYTRQCIESIRMHTTPGSYELLVVDNASTDGSVEWLREQEDVRCIYNKENRGFPAGCNQGMAAAAGTAFLLLNSDTIVTPRWLEQLNLALCSDDKIGAVGCVTNVCSNGQQVPVPYHDVRQMLPFAEQYNQSDPAQWQRTMTLVGFCFLLKRAVWEKIGPMDEAFSPGNFEDDDYSLRIWEAGWEMLLCRDTFIHHFGSAAFFVKNPSAEEHKKQQAKYHALMQKNHAYFLEKWQLPRPAKIVHRVINQLPAAMSGRKRLLEIGCGCGMDLFLLEARYPGCRLQGIASTAAEMAIARRAFDVSCCEDLEQDLASTLTGKYDYILITEVLDAVQDKKAFLDGLQNYLLPRGEILFSLEGEVRHIAHPFLPKAEKKGSETMVLPVSFADFSPTVRKIYCDPEHTQTAATLGPGSYLVSGSLEFGSRNCHVLIGRYSALGHRLIFEIGLNHDYHQVTSYPFADILAGHDESQLNHADRVNHNQIIIGNDVWMGCDVMVMGGIRIGNGAVVGAGSVVAKDVPPYAVVVGNPARIVKYRFSEDIVHKLQQIRWWNWPADKIRQNLPKLESVEAFVAEFYHPELAKLVQDETLLELKKQRKVFFFMADFGAAAPVWPQVIQQYVETFSADAPVALAIELPPSAECSQQLQAFMDKWKHPLPLIMHHRGSGAIPLGILQSADYFITTREDVSSICIDYAAAAGITILSGLDRYMFADLLPGPCVC